jgi:hypothetical protein
MIMDKMGFHLLDGSESLTSGQSQVSDNIIDLYTLALAQGYTAGTDQLFDGPSGVAGELPWITVYTKTPASVGGTTSTLKVAFVASHIADLGKYGGVSAGSYTEINSVTITDLTPVTGDPRVAVAGGAVMRQTLDMSLQKIIDKFKGSSSTDIRYLGFLITATNGNGTATGIALTGSLSPTKPEALMPLPPSVSNVGVPSNA